MGMGVATLTAGGGVTQPLSPKQPNKTKRGAEPKERRVGRVFMGDLTFWAIKQNHSVENTVG